jgi:hypothetical protein
MTGGVNKASLEISTTISHRYPEKMQPNTSKEEK